MSAQAGQLLLLLTAGLAGLLAVVVGRRRPDWAVTAWMLCVSFVPIWAGLNAGAYFPPASLIGVVVLASLVRVSTSDLRFGAIDVVIAAFFAACVVPFFLSAGSRSTIFSAIAIWLVGYLIGRLAPSVVSLERIQAAAALVLGAVAVLAMIEFVADWHPYANWGPANRLRESWSEIQIRGGIARSEWAFGHSIALGLTLASVIPLAATAQQLRPAVRVVVVGCLLGGVLVSVSRIAMICAVLAVVLVVVFGARQSGPTVRGWLVGISVVGALAALPFVSGVLGAAGSEATDSATYRGDLLVLVNGFSVLGQSPLMHVAADGALYFGGFRSIDSQLLLTGLTYGWLAVAISVIALVAAVLLLLRGRATPATLSLVTLIPSLLVVALITQFASWFWFIAGLAVASQVARGGGAGNFAARSDTVTAAEVSR